MTTFTSGTAPQAGAVPAVDLAVLQEIEQRVLWLATRIIDAANHDRDDLSGIKVGGHQASSASVVSIMTALYFAHLNAADRVSVKPHASPVLHAINYLLGRLDRRYLTTLRQFHGLQSYPSRTKDPDPIDFSTGSVGLGAIAPLFANVTRRYVDAHFGPRNRSRFVALIGDAELDEGNIWEAVTDPATDGLGETVWIVDFNRQSLDRVIPGVRANVWKSKFAASGWHVIEVKYGRKLQAAFAQPGGDALRGWIDDMPNEQYQSIFGLTADAVRDRFLEGAPSSVTQMLEGVSGDEISDLVTDLGGHDIGSLLTALRECDATTEQPSVVFAYTVKGWGLPMAGDRRNHSAILSTAEVDAFREQLGLSLATEWDVIDPDSAAGAWVKRRAAHLRRPDPVSIPPVAVPSSTDTRHAPASSTQEAFGRVMVDLSRHPDVAPYLVTTSPDVATSTNLAGFMNRAGVFHPETRPNWGQDVMLKWVESPAGQHIELGISEMNLFGLLGQLGLSWDLSQQVLLPVGTVYDPFVLRGLDALIYGAYSGSHFVVVGTPSGVTLAPEGGAHQSTITASVGLELPGITMLEPAYGKAVEWLLCWALSDIAKTCSGARNTVGGSFYFRLTTRPLDQAPFQAARNRFGDAVLRRQVLAGGYQLLDTASQLPTNAPFVYILGSGPVLAEVLAAAEELSEEGVGCHVIEITSNDRLYRAWQANQRHGIHSASATGLPGALRTLFPTPAPIVTVHDAASHTMSWFGSAVGVPSATLGVDKFGQSGTIEDLYREFDLLPGSITNAALGVLTQWTVNQPGRWRAQ